MSDPALLLLMSDIGTWNDPRLAAAGNEIKGRSVIQDLAVSVSDVD
ncbi:hypothetical protein QIS74_07651 [Colletotrichum tabaci]|uniref:Uncharacterized protein n=1 Tax=Colletotrichum tabaci TaxID=1209068 RepID=A0AAV9TED5_9PEZI